MLLQKFWKKRIMVIGAMVFLLTLCALNLDALVSKGKPEASQAQAAMFPWIFLPLEARPGPDPFTFTCVPWGFTCFIILADNGVQQRITLT